MRRTPIPLQTTYAELLERVALDEHAREFPDYGGFAPKTVKGRRYVYWRGQSAGVRKEKLVGPDSPETWARIERGRTGKADQTDRERLVNALIASGFPSVPAGAGQILRALSSAGVFRRGGMLIGTWAFSSYGPALGAILPVALGQTQDLDILQIEVVTEEPPVSLLDELRYADPTFEPKFSRMYDGPPWTFEAASGFRLEFLTIKSRRTSDDPVAISSIGIGALPLAYQEYLLDGGIDAAMLFRSGVLVRVPAPERFAMHKLLVSQIRVGADAAVKARKDVAQARAIVEVVLQDRPMAVNAAWIDIIGRGKKWKRHAEAGLNLLGPELSTAVRR